MSEFFAGTNTEAGFKGYLEEYFAHLNKIYIIKGTPGSGKSTLMRRLAAECEERGYEVERVYCSSDPSSLDGIILPEKGYAVADGTAPHVLEPKYPLAREILVDVGRLMNTKNIDSNGIIKASAKKSRHYSRAYGYIKSAVEAGRNRESTAAERIDTQKLLSFAERFYKRKLCSDTAGGVSVRVAAAFTGKGLQVLDPFGEQKDIYVLAGCRGCEGYILDIFKSIALKAGERVVLCPHPTDSKKINGIFFCGKRVYITATKSEKGEKLSFSRFFEKETATDTRALLKESACLAENAYALAERELSAAAYYHGVLESLYAPAMDFSLLDGEYSRLVKLLTE